MPMNVGDILKITDKQTLFNKNIYNVYWYRVQIVGPDALYTDVADLFDANVVSTVCEIQADVLTHQTITVENMTNGLDFVTILSGQGGVHPEDVSSLNLAISFTLQRSSKITRSGGKRIGGIPDVAYDSNLMTAGWQVGANNLAQILDSNLEHGIDGDSDNVRIAPVIVGRSADAMPDLSRWQRIAAVTWHEGASTQVSRKRL